jgi:hypothetical protein
MLKSVPGIRGAAPQIIVVMNWVDELKRLVPVN